MKDIKPPNIVNVQTVKCLFDSAVLNEFVNNTVLKLKENKAHSEILRQELSSYRFESPDEDISAIKGYIWRIYKEWQRWGILIK